MANEPKTDQVLLSAFLQDGNREAYGELVERHSGMVYRVCFRMLRDHHAAEDATQATFATLLQKAESIRGHQSLGSWLFGVARLTSRSLLRTQRRRQQREEDVAMAITESQHVDSVWQRAMGLLDEGLAELSPRQREAVVLRHLEGRSIAEAAAQVGCTEAVLTSRTRDGLKKIRKFFSERGVVVSVLFLLSLLESEAKAEVPSTLAASIQARSESTQMAYSSSSMMLKAVSAKQICIRIMLLMLIGVGVLTVMLAQQKYQTVHKQAQVLSQPALAKPPLPTAVQQALKRGFAYMRSTQRADGAWAARGDQRVIASTSLSILAFMVHGAESVSAEDAEALARGSAFLLQQAQASASGYLGATMYEHALATLALTRLWLVGGRKQDAIYTALEAAVQVILRAQNRGGGWRYQPSPECGQDTSVTSLVAGALATARQAGIIVPFEALDKVVDYLQGANTSTEGFAYVPNPSKQNASLTCTFGGLYAAYLCGARNTPMVNETLQLINQYSEAEIIARTRLSHYYPRYYFAQVLMQSEADLYNQWYPKLRLALLNEQSEKGAWGKKGHEYLSTAIAILILGSRQSEQQWPAKAAGRSIKIEPIPTEEAF